MATLYFNAAIDNNWNTLGNWWEDFDHTVPATSLPTSSDDVVARGSIDSATSEPTVNSFSLFSPNGEGYTLNTNITVLNGATFESAYFVPGAGNYATITGSASFSSRSYNAGTITGNATFSDATNDTYGVVQGDATFTGNSINIGTVQGTPTYSGYTGWGGDNPASSGYGENIYFINGQQTSLDISGDGTWDGYVYYQGCNTNIPNPGVGYDYYCGSNTYYIDGVGTTLDSYGWGNWNGYIYADGCNTGIAEGGTGYDSSCTNSYWVNGCQSSLDSSGTGYDSYCTYSWWIDGCQTNLDGYGTGTGYDSYCTMKYYIDFVETTLDSDGTGSWDGYYYLYGFPTTLDSNGTGSYNGYYWINGCQTDLSENGTGFDSYCTYSYYINGALTTLDSNGDGTWNGVEYLNGLAARILYYNAATDTNWETLTNWWNNQSCTEQAVSLPTTIDSVVIITGAAVLSGNPSSIKNLTVL